MNPTALAVFDFDGTLFRSPERPSWWPWHGYWGRSESLSPPYVPEVPGPDWWAEEVVRIALDVLAHPATHVIVLTGRPEKLTDRVKALLRSVNLCVHGCYCVGNGSGNTLEMKKLCIQRLFHLSPQLERIDMWEDREEHIGPFEALLAEFPVAFKVHRVPRATREFAFRPDGVTP